MCPAWAAWLPTLHRQGRQAGEFWDGDPVSQKVPLAQGPPVRTDPIGLWTLEVHSLPLSQLGCVQVRGNRGSARGAEKGDERVQGENP